MKGILESDKALGKALLLFAMIFEGAAILIIAMEPTNPTPLGFSAVGLGLELLAGYHLGYFPRKAEK